MIDSMLDPLWLPEDDLRCAGCDRDRPFAHGRWARFGSGGFVYALCAACLDDMTERPPLRAFHAEAMAWVAPPPNTTLKNGSIAWSWHTTMVRRSDQEGA